ncbi:MAG TPA: hypothetical protein VGG68_00040 [Caulobacteraceae bacterium]
MALIAANHSGSPEMARAIMGSVGGGPDAGSTVQNLMSLYSAQQGMAAQQQMLGQSGAIAKRLNMDEGVVRAEIMAGRGPDLVRSLEPGEQQKNIIFQHDQFIAHGGTEDDWNKNILPTVMMGSLPGMTPDYMSYLQERNNWPQTHPGQPVPDFVQWKNIVQQEQVTTKDKQDMVTNAQGQMHTLLGPLTSMEGKVNGLQTALDAGKLDKLFQLPPAAIKAIATSDNVSTANNVLNGITRTLGFGDISLSPEELNYAKDIYELSQNQQNMHALGATSSRTIAPQFETIGSFLGPVGDLSRGKQGWSDNLGKLRDNILNGEASIYGEANITPTGDPAHVDELLKRTPPQYVAGGAMNLRPPTPIPPDEMAKVVAHLKQNPSDLGDVVQYLRAENHDPTDLVRRVQQGLT